MTVRQGFVPARREPQVSGGVPESASPPTNEPNASELAVRQGFEPWVGV